MSQIKGLDQVLKNLDKEIQAIKGRTLKGLIRATIPIRQDMDKKSPTIPVDWGNLRASWFVTTSKGNVQRGKSPHFKGDTVAKMSAQHDTVLSAYQAFARMKDFPFVVMGFSAYYATYVHEMLGASFQRPDSGPKFFEAAFKRNAKGTLKIIAENARIKK